MFPRKCDPLLARPDVLVRTHHRPPKDEHKLYGAFKVRSTPPRTICHAKEERSSQEKEESRCPSPRVQPPGSSPLRLPSPRRCPQAPPPKPRAGMPRTAATLSMPAAALPPAAPPRAVLPFAASLPRVDPLAHAASAPAMPPVAMWHPVATRRLVASTVAAMPPPTTPHRPAIMTTVPTTMAAATMTTAYYYRRKRRRNVGKAIAIGAGLIALGIIASQRGRRGRW